MNPDKKITRANGGAGGVYDINGGRGKEGDIAIDGIVYTSEHPDYQRVKQQAITATAQRIGNLFGNRP